MHCPRCEALLEHRLCFAGSKWLSFFLCDSCWTAWHFADGVLIMGRTARLDLEDGLHAHSRIVRDGSAPARLR